MAASCRLSASALVLVLAATGAAAADPIEPRPPRRCLHAADLAVSTPEEQGMDSVWLRRAVQFMLDEKEAYRPHQVVVVRHGRRVLDVVFYPFQRGWRHDLASVTKVLTGTLVGAAVRAGFIPSMDDRVVSFFADRTIANPSAWKSAITVSNLLEQRSGLATSDVMEAKALEQEMYASGDYVQWALDQPMAEAPGWGYLYTSWNPHLAAAIVAETTGMTPLAFGGRTVFGPMGIRDVVWPADPQGINRGYGDLQLRPLDLAKIGQLYLNHGAWKGQELLDPEWVARATSATPGPSPAGWPPEIGIGYHWEVGSDYRSGTGSAGQVVRFFPALDLVLITVAGGGSGYAGNTYSALAEQLTYGYVKPAIRSDSPLAPNPSAVAGLQQLVAVAALSDEPDPQPVPALPATAAAVSGKPFVMDPNPMELYSFVLSFPGGDEAELVFTSAGSASRSLHVGLDGVFRFFPGENGVTWRARGEWEDPSTFVCLLDEIGSYHFLRFTSRFSGSTVTITVDDLSLTAPSFTMQGRME
jgi:CubicO group peptidase (beta-lactamase class C family)